MQPMADDDLADILALLHGRLRFSLRLAMVLIAGRGHSPATVADLFDCDPRTVHRWLRRFEHGGIGDLHDRPRSGRPRLGSPRLGERIRRLIAEPRAWTVPRLWRRLRPQMSPATLARRVREVASWRRPRLVARGDPDEANVLKQMWVAVSSLPEHAVVLAEDETHLSLLPWLRSTWVPTGKRMRIMTPGTNVRRTIFGAIDLRTGRWLHLVSPRATAATFIEFLELILAAYPSAPSLAILLDNVSAHRSKTVTSWLERHPRMQLIYGPRYCPHHNPVERIWGALKSHLADAPVGTMPGRVRQVHAFFRQRDDDQLLRCASPFSSPWITEAYGQNLWKAA